MEKIFKAPTPDAQEREVIAQIRAVKDELQNRVAEPLRWVGSMRRIAFARNVQGSNSIEGYNATLDDVLAAVDGEQPADADSETRLALSGYRDAMTYVLQLGQDPAVNIDEGLVKGLHYMMLKHDLPKNPGRWRPGDIYLRREQTGEIVYTGPDHDRIPDLIASMLAQLRSSGGGEPLFRAAMAHLNLVMIHPFSDGNGRMARCLQTLVLAREQILNPAFSSIEEYLGRNTLAYYEVLGEVGAGSWNPDRDARPWIRFCLTAHLRQAKTLLRRIADAEELWSSCWGIALEHGLPERTVGALMDAAYGFRIRRSGYQELTQTTVGEQISDLTATRDLKAMVDAGLLTPIGEGRGRHYLGTAVVTDAWMRIRSARPKRDDEDPFNSGQLTLTAVPD